MPDTRPKLYRVHGQVDMSLNKKPKTTYLSEIIDKAKSPGQRRPGPSDYSYEKAWDYAKPATTKKFAWNKLKRSSIIDDVIKREKNLKGPADYNDERKVKILGQYSTATAIGQLMNETEFMAKSVPASNQYKLNYESQAKAVRQPRADLNRDKSPKNPMVALKKNDSPSPVTYKDVDKNWSKTSNFPVTNFNYSIQKEPKKSFLD